MGIIYSVSNFKGGCGKTSTALNLGAALAASHPPAHRLMTSQIGKGKSVETTGKNNVRLSKSSRIVSKKRRKTHQIFVNNICGFCGHFYPCWNEATLNGVSDWPDIGPCRTIKWYFVPVYYFFCKRTCQFEAPNMHWLNERLFEKGHKICFMAEYYLPDISRIQVLSCAYKTHKMVLCPCLLFLL